MLIQLDSIIDFDWEMNNINLVISEGAGVEIIKYAKLLDLAVWQWENARCINNKMLQILPVLLDCQKEWQLIPPDTISIDRLRLSKQLI